MGPLPGELAAATHLAGLKHGMIWTEGATGLGQLPATGAFYCTFGVKHQRGIGAEGRACAIVGDPLARQLIEAARAQRVIDLSVLLAENMPVWWPGRGVGRHRQPYFRKILYTWEQTKGSGFGQTHILDSNTGTHLVPPAYSLPPERSDNPGYAPAVRAWLAEYEKKYGPRGTSDQTADKVPLAQTGGWARVIDVKHLIGSTDRKSWPASPEITTAEIQRYEGQHGVLKPGEVVIFHSGYSDRFARPFPEGEKCMADPLNGKSEGWPAPGPDAIIYLATKGIRCVATDGPTLGGTEPGRALKMYWALGSKEMAGVEYLTNVGKLPAKAYFLFAPVKIRGCHGGPGRAIALYWPGSAAGGE
jgi:kynurenine formamidase